MFFSVGLFSTRTPHRPNAIGLTLAKLIAVDKQAGTITVRCCLLALFSLFVLSFSCLLVFVGCRNLCGCFLTSFCLCMLWQLFLEADERFLLFVLFCLCCVQWLRFVKWDSGVGCETVRSLLRLPFAFAFVAVVVVDSGPWLDRWRSVECFLFFVVWLWMSGVSVSFVLVFFSLFCVCLFTFLVVIHHKAAQTITKRKTQTQPRHFVVFCFCVRRWFKLANWFRVVRFFVLLTILSMQFNKCVFVLFVVCCLLLLLLIDRFGDHKFRLLFCFLIFVCVFPHLGVPCGLSAFVLFLFCRY